MTEIELGLSLRQTFDVISCACQNLGQLWNGGCSLLGTPPEILGMPQDLLTRRTSGRTLAGRLNDVVLLFVLWCAVRILLESTVEWGTEGPPAAVLCPFRNANLRANVRNGIFGVMTEVWAARGVRPRMHVQVKITNY